ncbi:hypothetical protein [Bifidobacterium biavatii]|nr:hypothetical protein [Bifidobacterium biavatii]
MADIADRMVKRRKEHGMTPADLTGIGVKAGIPRARCLSVAKDMQKRIADAGFAVRD